jgi:hypothetical protein
VRGSPTPPGKCVFPADCTRRTRTLPRVRSAVVLPTVGDPRRIRSLQPVQPAVLSLTAGQPRRTHSLLPVQPVVLFACGGRVLFTLPPCAPIQKHAFDMSPMQTETSNRDEMNLTGSGPCPGPPGRLSVLSVFLCKSVLYGDFVWGFCIGSYTYKFVRPTF